MSLLPTLNICLKYKNLRFIQKYKMIKTRTIKTKSNENEETAMAKRMIKIIIITIIMITIIMMVMTIKIDNGDEIKTLKLNKNCSS